MVAVVVWQERKVLKGPESMVGLLLIVLEADVVFFELCTSIFAMVSN